MSEFTKTDIEDIKTSIQTINGQTLKNTNAKLDYLDKKLTFFLKCNPPLRFPAFFTKKTLIGRVVSWCKK